MHQLYIIQQTGFSTSIESSDSEQNPQIIIANLCLIPSNQFSGEFGQVEILKDPIKGIWFVSHNGEIIELSTGPLNIADLWVMNHVKGDKNDASPGFQIGRIDEYLINLEFESFEIGVTYRDVNHLISKATSQISGLGILEKIHLSVGQIIDSEKFYYFVFENQNGTIELLNQENSGLNKVLNIINADSIIYEDIYIDVEIDGKIKTIRAVVDSQGNTLDLHNLVHLSEGDYYVIYDDTVGFLDGKYTGAFSKIQLKDTVKFNIRIAK